MRTELEIITNAFYLSEQDNDVWETDSDEYEVARGFLNAGINRWEGYDDTPWRELITFLSDALTGDKVLTTGYSYDCPDNFMKAGGWVRTGSTPRFWRVIKPEEVSRFAGSQIDYCYFVGDEANGFTLKFNPLSTLTAGDSIEYEYYRKAATTSASGDKVEMSDPYFLSYFIAAHLGEDGIDGDKFTIAEARLDTMKTKNMSGVFSSPNDIESSDDFAFGA